MTELNEREEGIFNEAKNFSDAEKRAAYLKLACHGDVALQQRLERLLDAAGRATDFFENPAADDEDTVEAIGSVLSEGPGTLIGRYKILQQIGEGGMGAVFMAEQTEPVVRKVALKIIKLGMDTRQVVARFEAERQALAMMDHPNIARVLDAGATESGRPYFVMELVKGVPITEYCDKNKLSAAERLNLFMPVCHAIQHAHQKGIIHRDIKPANVMVTLHDGNPIPKVIDFGIAKATNQKLTEKTLFTNYAQMIGTPAYMSPEQAELSGLDVDTRTDVYSLGVLLYELLTGTTPFPVKELMSMGYGEIQRVIAEKEPPKPSTRLSTMGHEQLTAVAQNRSMEASAVGRVFAGDLDWIVMKALEKDRTHRYETVNGLVADVKRHLDDEPVTAAAPTFAYQVRKFYRRNRPYLRAAAAVFLLLLVGALFSSWQAVRATRAKAVAEEQTQRALLERGRAEEQSQLADQKRQQVELAQEELRKELYLADMSRVAQAYKANNHNEVKSLLAKHIPRSGQKDLRGFEWRMWMGAAQREAKTLPRWVGRGVIAVSPVKEIAAIAGYPSVIHIIDLRTYQLVHEISLFHEWDQKRELGYRINDISLSFTPDGQWLIGACLDGRVRRWRTKSWERDEVDLGIAASNAAESLLSAGDTTEDPGDRLLEGFPNIAVSPNNDYAIVSTASSIFVCSLSEWRITHHFSIPDHSELAPFLFFSEDGECVTGVVFSGGETRQRLIKLTAPFTRIEQSREFQSSLNMGRVAVPISDWIAIGCGTEGIKFFDRDDLTPRTDLMVNTGSERVSYVFPSPTRERMAVVQESGVVRVFETEHLSLVGEIPGYSAAIHRLEFMPDGRRMIVSYKDDVVKVWDPERAGATQAVPGTLRGRGFAFLADGRLLWRDYREPQRSEDVLDNESWGRIHFNHDFGWCSEPTPIRVFDLAEGAEQKLLLERESSLVTHSVSANGRFLAGLSPDGILHLWNLVNRRLLGTVPLPRPYKTSGCGSLIVADSGVRVAWMQSVPEISRSTQTMVWDTEQSHVFELEPRRTVYRIEFDSSGDRLAQLIHGTVSRVEVWRLNETKGLFDFRFLPGYGPSGALAFSPVGDSIAAGGFTRRVFVHGLADGGGLRTFKPHSEPIHEVAYTVDGRQIISGGGDRWIRVWDSRTGDLRTVLPSININHWVRALVMDARGEQFGFKVSDELFRVWAVPPFSETDTDPEILLKRVRSLMAKRNREGAQELARRIPVASEVGLLERSTLAVMRGDYTLNRRLIREAFNAFGQSLPLRVRGFLCWNLLLSDDEADTELGVRLLNDFGTESRKLDPFFGISDAAAAGLAYYRVGDFQSVDAVLRPLIDEPETIKRVPATVWTLRAMVAKQTGQRAEAEAYLNQARDLYERYGRNEDDVARGSSWVTWLPFGMLLQEAEALIEGEATTEL